MKRFMLPLILLTFILSAQTPVQVGQPSISYRAWPPSIADYSEQWLAPKLIYAFNASGDTLKVGDVVIWQATKTLIDSVALDGTGTDTLTVGDSLKTTIWHDLRIKTLNAISACSVDVKGLDSADVLQTDVVVINGGANVVAYSTKKWRKLSFLAARHHAANDSLVIYAIPQWAVTTTTSAKSALVAGVVVEQSLSKALTKIMVQGITQVKLLGSTEITPGAFIGTGGTARYGLLDASPAAGAGLGTVLQSGNTNGLYWVFVNVAY